MSETTANLTTAPALTSTVIKVGRWTRLYAWLDKYAPRLLIAVGLIYLITFTAASVYKWETYQTGYDQIYFEQPLWNTTEGRFMQQSDFAYSTSAFAVDFMPGLVLFVPFYWLVPSPHTLFFLETLILVLGMLPVYWLARDKFGGNKAVGLAFAVAYLAHPTLQYFNLLPFNMRAMGLVCLLYAFYFFEKRKWWPFVLFMVLALSTRTEVSLIVAMFGIYGLIRRAPLKFWLTPLLVGSVYFVLVFAVILQLFITPGTMVVPPEVQPVKLSQQQLDYISNTDTIISTTYGDLGKNLPDVLLNTVKNPLKTAQRVFTVQKMQYLILMLLPFAFLSLLSPSVMLLALPIVAINLLSSRATQFDYKSHYSALLLFPLIIGAVYGSANLLKILQKRGWGANWRLGRASLVSIGGLLAILAVFVLGVQVVMRNPLPGVVRNAEKPTAVTAINKIVAQVPRNASVSATSFLAPHLLPRQYSTNFPLALYEPPPAAIQYFLIDTNAQALYKKENNIEGQLPIDFVQKNPQLELVAQAEIKGQKDDRNLTRTIQLWRRKP